ncbi:MAG: carbohydrate ABC transporter permease [Caldilineaceae bacterium]|nr:carbohydrate ABC transporter permease [Caldilineaceae bacterium]
MKRRNLAVSILLFILALFWLLVAIVPFGFMLLSSFKQSLELMTAPIWALPQAPTLDNYRTVLENNFLRYLTNSIIVVTVSIALVLILSAMAAYIFARVPFRGNRIIFLLVIAGLIVPIHVTLIPVYLLTSRAGIYDSLYALIGPYVAFSLPLSIFILTQFMRQIPREMEEAARIDGCGPMRAFFSIILPLSKAGLVTIAIFNAVTLWNEFVFAFVLTSSPGVRTLPLAIWDFQGEYSANIPMIMTVLTLSALPLILAYSIFQEQLERGIMAGAIKG